jgi:hypothetical protein
MAVGADEGAGTDQVVGEGAVVADAARHRGGLGGERKEVGVVTTNRKAGTTGEAEFQRRVWAGCEGRPQGGKRTSSNKHVSSASVGKETGNSGRRQGSVECGDRRDGRRGSGVSGVDTC